MKSKTVLGFILSGIIPLILLLPISLIGFKQLDGPTDIWGWIAFGLIHVLMFPLVFAAQLIAPQIGDTFFALPMLALNGMIYFSIFRVFHRVISKKSRETEQDAAANP